MTTPVRHPATYDARRARYVFAHASYIGGETYRNPPQSVLSDARLEWSRTTLNADGQPVTTNEEKRTRSYLVPFPAEDDRSFSQRQALASYVNPVEIIVDAYSEGATGDVQRNLGALEPYAGDIDLRGSTWGEFVEDIARWDCVYGGIAIVVDTPAASEKAVTRADEIAKGARPYCVCVHPTSWAWVVTDGFGRLMEFAYTDEPYHTDVETAGSSSRPVTVRVFHRGRTDKAGAEMPPGWEVLRGSVNPTKTLFEQRGQLVAAEGDSGPLDARLDGRLPVVFSFYRRDTSSRYPLGISLIENACDLARTIYNRRSYELTIQREAGFPTLAIPMSSTGGKLDAGTRITLGSSKGIAYDSTSGAPSWIQPSAEWAADMRESNVADFQAALRTAGLEMATEAGASASGEALRIRSRDFEARCKRFARNLQRTEMATLELVALMAGASFEGVAVTYPRRFVLPDLTANLTNALMLLDPAKMPVDIGETATTEAVMQAIGAAIVLTDEKAREVRAQIEATLRDGAAEQSAEARLRSMARDKAITRIAPPPTPDAPPQS